jgi:hypothetical protein
VRRLALLMALLVTAVCPADAAVLDYVLGVLGDHPRHMPDSFSTVRPKPDWEAALATADLNAGHTLFTTGQTNRTATV